MNLGEKGRNASATALSWFASDTAHPCVHPCKVRGEASAHPYGEEISKSCVKAELCSHRYVHFSCVPMYIFGFRHKLCSRN